MTSSRIRVRKERKVHLSLEDCREAPDRPLPVVALRGMMVFPHMSLHFDVGRMRTIKALEHAMHGADQQVLLLAQKVAATEEPTAQDLYDMGVVGTIKQMVQISSEVVRVVVESGRRARILEWTQSLPFAMARVELPAVPMGGSLEAEAVLRAVMAAYETHTQLTGKVSPEAVAIASINDLGHAADVIGGNVLQKLEDRQELLEEIDPMERASKLLAILERENEILAIEKTLRDSVRKQIASNQREYYLKEQMRAISKELGEGGEADELRQRVAELPLNDAAREVVERELDRLSRMPQQSPETGVIRTWIDLVCGMPWQTMSEDRLDLTHARAVLDRDHFGLDKVKERICEYLAVLQLKKTLKGPILCLVGPPGVGKTSIARSVAEALERKFTRISLGGMRDEAEIRGHRRTYIGAMAGRIITGIRNAGTRNPVILLDEIDKLASDFRGDPASALLEALDSEQNSAFSDHYLEIPFDLSQVLFITTANTMETVPRALCDRLEVIEVSGYTEDEKLRIAQDHLIPKQIEAHGLKKSMLKIKDEALLEMIRRYTREAGVRSLERVIARVCRKAAVRVTSEEKNRHDAEPTVPESKPSPRNKQNTVHKKSLTVGKRALEGLLGKPRYRYGSAEGEAEVGVAMGLAWTGSGGDVLPIEVAVVPGKGVLQLTGSLGNVMRESAQAAHTWVRAHAEEYGLKQDFFEIDLHIHVPEGAVPKDGPSAGITLCTAMVSAIAARPIRQDLAMTGEMTLRGKVLPIGGVKEKLLAAKRAGIATVLVPEENRSDIAEIPGDVLEGLSIHEVGNISQVLSRALLPGLKAEHGAPSTAL